jgi:hypothetical protein
VCCGLRKYGSWEYREREAEKELFHGVPDYSNELRSGGVPERAHITVTGYI